MTPQKTVSLDVDAAGFGRVLIDGHDISNCCTEIDVKIRAGRFSEITVRMSVDIKADVRARLENLGIIAVSDEVAP